MKFCLWLGVLLCCASVSYCINLGPGRCLISRLDVIQCNLRNPRSTRVPGPNEYGIYTTRFGPGSAGPTSCHIRRRGHKVQKIEKIGTFSTVFIVYSPGITLEPPEQYGNQMFVDYRIQCPEGQFAFLNITRLEMEEANCFDSTRNAMRCVDYVAVSRGDYGITESCGTDTGANSNDLEFGTFRMIFRTGTRVRSAGFIASIICFDPGTRQMEGCTNVEGSENPTTSSRRKREIQEHEEEWKRKMAHLTRVRRQVEVGKYDIRFIERNISFGINVTYSNKILNFIAVENGSVIESLRVEGVDSLFTFDGNGQLDLFQESAQSKSGVTLLLPGPGPMYVVGNVAYFQLFVIDPRGLVPTMEEMLVIANLTEAQIELAREDNSSRLSSEFLTPEFNEADIGLPPEIGRRRRSPRDGRGLDDLTMVARRRRQAVGEVMLSDDAVIAAIQNENACNPVLRASSRALLEQLDMMEPGRVAMIRATLNSIVTGG